jgi:hypothetical protein
LAALIPVTCYPIRIDRLFFKNLEEVKAFRFHSNGVEATGFDDCIVALLKDEAMATKR